MTDTRTGSRVWQRMAAALRLCAAYALWRDDEATSDQRQAALRIAQQRKFRPKTVIGLDEDRKARHLASLTTLPEALAARILVVYHLAEQRPMMGAFLDAIGIAHDNGVSRDDAVPPEPTKGPAPHARTAT